MPPRPFPSAGSQPSIAELTNHMAEVHPRVPLAPARKPASSTQCGICNKSFTTPVGLFSHQKDKKHFPPRPLSSPKFSGSQGLSATPKAPVSSIAPSGNATAKSDAAKPNVIYLCTSCGAEVGSAAELETHRSSHGKVSCSKCSRPFSSLLEWNDHFKQVHQKAQPNGHQAELAPDTVLVPHRNLSPAIIRPASSQSISNKSHSSNPNSKGLSVCDLCKKEFKSKAALQAHVAAKHPAAAECVICHIICPCPHSPWSPNLAIIRPTSSQSISNTSPPSNSNGKGLFVCEPCKKEFKYKEGLQEHVATKHPAAAECVICRVICPSTAALEEHVDTVHSCALCQDGILRDAQTLSDHMLEHSHPIICKKCGTRYETEEDRQRHFSAADNYHPVCAACHLGFEDDSTLRVHMDLIHPASPMPSPMPSSRQFSAELGVEVRAATKPHRVFECEVCNDAYASQTEFDVHIVTVHSCPICHDGIYMDTRALEQHLERHRSSFTCNSCGLGYEQEDQLQEHYNLSTSDVHPHCEKCLLGFRDNSAFTAHVVEAHPRIVCHVCESDFSDEEELAIHYLSSWKHPKCEKCGIGFRDHLDYIDHGASTHPECHCYLCQWNFDTPNVLQNHIKHFFIHPKCQDCNIRFADGDTYQNHLFIVHRPCFDDEAYSDFAAVEPSREDKIPQDNSSLNNRVFDPVWGFEGSASLPYASFVPLPPSLSGYSSPTSQRVAAGSGGSSESHSRSSTLSVEQRFPTTDGQPWSITIRTQSLDAEKGLKASPEFDHTPLSTLPAVGTPLISSIPMIRSGDSYSPFSPRPEPPALFPLSEGINSIAVSTTEHDDVKSNSSSSFTRSPPLISPVAKLPDPDVVSPTSTSSNWTMTSDTDSRRSPPHSQLTSSSKGTNGMLSAGQTATSGNTVPQLSLLVPSTNHLAGSARWCNSGYPSSISPESAGLSISASMTPEYIREARAYLSLTHQAQEPPPSPPIPHSPGNASPILSSTGLAIGDRGRRREVRFEDNILSDPAWDRQSTSSDSSLDPPVVLPRSSGLKMHGVSKLPRFSALRRPARKWANGHSRFANRRMNGTPSPSYHCRSCYKDHCEEPTTTTCGHLFCYECISTAIMKDSRCPVCDAPTLLYCLFRIDTSA